MKHMENIGTPAAEAMYKSKKHSLDILIGLDNTKLQQYVRGSWMSHAKVNMTKTELRFVKMVVQPSLSINVSSVSASMSDVLTRLTCILKSSSPDEEGMAKVKVALAACSGSLETHPFITGMVLQAHRLVTKQQRGMENMRGRRTWETEEERQHIADAGHQLALMGGHSLLAKELGIALPTTCVDELRKYSLPCPGLALLWPETVLKENYQLLDQRFIRAHGKPKRNLDIQ